jgi:DNA-binding NarL/FixJ family response regulator
LSTKILLADDSHVMRAAIARLLKEEPGIELVGEAPTFAEMIKWTATLNPDILLLDLYMPDEHEWPPGFVKAQVAQHKPCIIAISVSIDEKARVGCKFWRTRPTRQGKTVFRTDASNKASLFRYFKNGVPCAGKIWKRAWSSTQPRHKARVP